MNIEPNANNNDQADQLLPGLPGLKVVQQHCHFMRQASMPTRQVSVSDDLSTSMLSNAVYFDGGLELAHQACAVRTGYVESDLNNRMIELKQQPVTGCEAIRELGFRGCPTEGCTLPSGKKACAPAEMWEWNGIGWNGVPDPIILNAFRERHFPGGLIYSSENFQGYRKGAFERLNENAEIDKMLVRHLAQSASAPRVKSLGALLKSTVAELPQTAVPNRNFLCLTNGTLNLTTLQLEGHDRQHNLQHRIEHAWQPEAACPQFLQFLDQVFEPDSDRIEKIAFIQELMGYLLVPDTSLQKMVWLVGPGGNGKSVLLGVLVKLLGEKYVSTALLDRIDQPYVRAELMGKLLNISSEIPARAMIKDAFLKAIVAGELIEAAYKRKPSFSFAPVSRMIASTNNLPEPKDVTEGFNRRLVIVPFNRKFAESEQNPLLLAQLYEEIPGILKWAVDGLIRLRARGKFAVPPSSAAALEAFKVEANPIRQFSDECLIVSPNNKGIPATDLFKVYVDWCSERKLPCGNIISFGRGLADLGFKKRKSGKEFWLVSPNESNGPYFAQRHVLMGQSSMPVVAKPITAAPMILQNRIPATAHQNAI